MTEYSETPLDFGRIERWRADVYDQSVRVRPTMEGSHSAGDSLAQRSRRPSHQSKVGEDARALRGTPGASTRSRDPQQSSTSPTDNHRNRGPPPTSSDARQQSSRYPFSTSTTSTNVRDTPRVRGHGSGDPTASTRFTKHPLWDPTSTQRTAGLRTTSPGQSTLRTTTLSSPPRPFKLPTRIPSLATSKPRSQSHPGKASTRPPTPRATEDRSQYLPPNTTTGPPSTRHPSHSRPPIAPNFVSTGASERHRATPVGSPESLQRGRVRRGDASSVTVGKDGFGRPLMYWV